MITNSVQSLTVLTFCAQCMCLAALLFPTSWKLFPHFLPPSVAKKAKNQPFLACFGIFAPSESTCEILAWYHAPGAGWYWNPHMAAINIPIWFLTYIFSHYFKKHIKIFFKNSGQQRDLNHRPIDHEPRRLTSTPTRVLKHRFLSCMNVYGITRY